MSNTLQITRGDDESITVTFKDSDSNPIDITGFTVYFTAKNRKSDIDGDAVISKDITSHSDPVNGETVIFLSNTDTSIEPGTYYYDIQYKNTANEITTVIISTLEVKQDITTRTS